MPRIAIRMGRGEVAEVRGINEHQELEPIALDVAKSKLDELPGGKKYTKRVRDMKRLTELEIQIENNPDCNLSESDVRFLYEFDQEIEGFGYIHDPRVDQVLSKRDAVHDLEEIFDVSEPENVAAELSRAQNSLKIALLLCPIGSTTAQEVLPRVIESLSESEINHIIKKPEKYSELISAFGSSIVGRAVDLNVSWKILCHDMPLGAMVRAGLDINYIVTAELQRGDPMVAGENLDRFSGVSTEVAELMIDKGEEFWVMGVFDKGVQDRVFNDEKAVQRLLDTRQPL